MALTISRAIPTISQVMLLNRLLKGSVRTTNSLLESALNRPLNKCLYEQETNPANLAASLAYGIVKSHAFEDGNKRTALLSVILLLKNMGYRFKEVIDDEEVKIAKVHSDVEVGLIDEEQMARYYAEIIEKVEIPKKVV